jgi:hypothetical protein
MFLKKAVDPEKEKAKAKKKQEKQERKTQKGLKRGSDTEASFTLIWRCTSFSYFLGYLRLSLHSSGRPALRLSRDRCVHTAFLVSSSSFKLGVFHHCVTESSVAVFESFFACFRLLLALDWQFSQ